MGSLPGGSACRAAPIFLTPTSTASLKESSNVPANPLTRYAICGASGCGRGVMPLLREQLESGGEKGELLFVDDERSRQTDRVNGVR